MIKKYILPILLIGVLAFSFLGLPHSAFAQNAAPQSPSTFDCINNAASCLVYYVSWTVNEVLAVFVAFGAQVIKLGLTLNLAVFTSPTVQKGFAVSLALANLGFVLGIIIIAIATILRNETYGIKQMLWKLIMMAILVNFGLVITAPLVGFAGNLSTYFINATGGSEGAFVNNLTNAFAPQRLFMPTTDPGFASAIDNVACRGAYFDWQKAACSKIYAYVTGRKAELGTSASGDDFLRQIMAMIFSSVMLSIIVITFWAIGILLVVRYVYIGFLLILLPLAWLTWVFPKLSSNFSKWWGLFLKWTFFPPLTLFFIYLALQALSVGGQGNSFIQASQLTAQDVNGPAFTVAMTTGVVGLIQTALDQILLVGLCIGGLFAANAIGIKGAETAIHAAKWTGGQVTGYVGRKGKRAATYPLRTEMGRKATESLQRAGANRNFFARALLRPVREAGNALSSARKPAEKLTSDDKKKYGKYSLEEQARRIATVDAPGKLAIMSNIKDGLKGSNKAAAQAALNSLPANTRAQFDRLKLLYGKGSSAMPETSAEGSKTQKGKDILEKERKKKSEAGESTADLDQAIEALEDLEKEQGEIMKEEGSKTREAMRDEGKRNERVQRVTATPPPRPIVNNIQQKSPEDSEEKSQTS